MADKETKKRALPKRDPKTGTEDLERALAAKFKTSNTVLAEQSDDEQVDETVYTDTKIEIEHPLTGEVTTFYMCHIDDWDADFFMSQSLLVSNLETTKASNALDWKNKLNAAALGPKVKDFYDLIFSITNDIEKEYRQLDKEQQKTFYHPGYVRTKAYTAVEQAFAESLLPKVSDSPDSPPETGV